MNKQDLLDEQDAIKANSYTIVLWKEKWENYLNKSTYSHQWYYYKLESTNSSNIPQKPGIYTLLIQPGIANHPLCSYLMYVGKAKSLCRRFKQYLTSEKKRTEDLKFFDY